jgi:hypothetical protein
MTNSKDIDHGLFWGRFPEFPVGDREIMDTIGQDSEIRAKIWTRDLPNVKQNERVEKPWQKGRYQATSVDVTS